STSARTPATPCTALRRACFVTTCAGSRLCWEWHHRAISPRRQKTWETGETWKTRETGNIQAPRPLLPAAPNPQQEQTEVTERGLGPPACCVSIGVHPSLNPIGRFESASCAICASSRPSPGWPPECARGSKVFVEPYRRRFGELLSPIREIRGELRAVRNRLRPSRIPGMVRDGQPRLQQAIASSSVSIGVHPWLLTRAANWDRLATPRRVRPNTPAAEHLAVFAWSRVRAADTPSPFNTPSP
ncbi:MAG: hypothetical protein RJB55_2068, partial [Verrucomicrobiota bacterium]